MGIASPSDPLQTEYRFGRFRLIPAERRLWVDDEAVSLGPRAFNLLVLLVQRAGQLVTKDEILSRVWSGLVVEENNLQVQVSTLRKVLGYEAIATVPGAGYRFTLPLERDEPRSNPAGEAPAQSEADPVAQALPQPVERNAAGTRSRRAILLPALLLLVALAGALAWWLRTRPAQGDPAAAASVRTGIPPPYSLAILPFHAPSGAAAETQLAEALTRLTTASLARRYRAARIIAHRLAVSLPQGRAADPRALGRELSVRYVVEAEVEQIDRSVRVSVRLVDTVSADTVSSNDVQFGAQDLAAERDLMVARLTEQIGRAFARAERRRATASGGDSAIDLVGRGHAIYVDENLTLEAARKARPLFEEALHRDPKYVPAMIGVWWMLSAEYEDDLQADRDALVRAMDQISTRAVAADWDYADAWKIRALSLRHQARWSEAQEAIAQARRIDPTDPDHLIQNAFILLTMGRPEEALALAAQASRLVGLDTEYEVRMVCWSNLALSRPDAALPACAKTAALSNNWWRDQMVLAGLFTMLGAADKAAVARNEALKLQPALTIASLRRQRYSDHPEYLKWWDGVFNEALKKAGIPEL